MAAAKSSAVATTEQPRTLGGSRLQIQTVEDLTRVADLLYRGGITPPGIDSPSKLGAVILAGLEVGLCPTQALGSIMLTNGRLSIYGDAALAMVRASGLLTSIDEQISGEGDERKCVCRITRKGENERSFSFSMGEAKRAGLIQRAMGKDGKGNGPWVSYPDRMLMFRARGWALRDVFPDVLRGLTTHEEAADEEPRVIQVEATPVATTPTSPPPPALAAAPSAPAATSAPVSTSASLPPASEPDPNAPITDEQKSEVKFIKERWATAIGADGDEQRTKWVELLGTYGVDSALKFTQSQAAKFIEEVGKKYDPFGHPSATLQT